MDKRTRRISLSLFYIWIFLNIVLISTAAFGGRQTLFDFELPFDVQSVEPNDAKAELVKLRYVAGLTCGQAADLLDIAHSTADEYWAYARAWLKADIMAQDEPSAT